MYRNQLWSTSLINFINVYWIKETLNASGVILSSVSLTLTVLSKVQTVCILISLDMQFNTYKKTTIISIYIFFSLRFFNWVTTSWRISLKAWWEDLVTCSASSYSTTSLKLLQTMHSGSVPASAVLTCRPTNSPTSTRLHSHLWTAWWYVNWLQIHSTVAAIF